MAVIDTPWLRLGNILSFGKYTHREPAGPDMTARIDVARRLAYHTRFLREVARSSPQIEVNWDLTQVNRSLQFLADHATDAGSKSAGAAATIFLRTQDYETRHNCLETLSRMTNPKAKAELLRLSQRKDLDQAGKDLLISYLTMPTPVPSQPIGPLAVSNEKPRNGRVDQ